MCKCATILDISASVLGISANVLAISATLFDLSTTPAEEQTELPEPRSMRVDNKMFYFDVGQNRRGVFLRISEVSPSCRKSVVLFSLSFLKKVLNEVISLNCGKSD